MIISFILAHIAISIFLYYFTARFTGVTLTAEMINVLAGFAIFGIFPSIANMIWCALRFGETRKPTSLVGLIFSILALVLFLIYIVMRYVIRIHELGMTIF